LEFLQVDCFPVEDPLNLCQCCSSCCNHEGVIICSPTLYIC
jgi:hypothetical protein